MGSHRRRSLGAVVIVVATLLAFSVPAFGQDKEPNSIRLRRVDSTDPTDVRVAFAWSGARDQVTGTKLAENRRDVDASDPVQAGSTDGPAAGILIVLDASGSTDDNATLSEGKRAALALVESKLPNEQMAVVVAGQLAALTQRFTNDAGLVTAAINEATPRGDGALWDGMRRATAQFLRQPDLLPTIVLITDGNQGGFITFDQARGSVIDAGAPVHVIALNDGKLGGEPRELARLSGGGYHETSRATDLPKLMSQVGDSIRNTWEVSYRSEAERGVTDIDLTIDGVTAQGSYVGGSVATGVEDLVRQEAVKAKGIKFFQNKFGETLGIALALVAAMMGAFGILLIFFRDDRLDAVLAPYAEGFEARPGGEEEEGDSSLAQTALLQRAVDFTEQFAERQGLLTKIEGALEQADLPLRAGEALFFYVAVVAVVGVLGFVISGNLLGGLFVLLIAALLPPAILSFLKNRRRAQFEAQLPDTLQLLASTLRAGYSMMQGVEAVSQETIDPMGRELRRVITEARLGRPLEEALQTTADRMGSGDFAWAVMAIRIQREVGGNLSELLVTVAETMTHRERLRREVKALTAEGRMSAIILGIMPVAMLLILWSLNPDYIGVLFDETLGQFMLIGSALLAGLGFWWMSKIIKIDI